MINSGSCHVDISLSVDHGLDAWCRTVNHGHIYTDIRGQAKCMYGLYLKKEEAHVEADWSIAKIS